LVRTLARCGADVAIHYHANREMADQLRAEVIAMGRRAMVAQADVGDRDAVLALRDAVLSGLGGVDVVVNNAVASSPWLSVLEQPVADYEGQFRSSVLHNVLMAQAFVPGMIERGVGGRVIGISTECVLQAFPTQSAYVSGKRGMDGVLRVLAREVGPHGVTVNQVAPGWTISDRSRANADDDANYIEKVPLRRRGTDQEIANLVAFLASDLASFVTGAYIPVCGGNVMVGV
jgi:3-oxoacyl-[acyl-carrier protein] reductase